MNGLNSNDRQLLARLIERFNLIESNAKRIDELPAISSLVGDSKLHVSVNGTSYSMTVQELLSAIESRKYDHITFINDLEINGNTLTADSAGWVIQDVVYNLTNPFEGTIPYANEGFQRTDLLIATTNNDFLVIQGDENEGISFAPPLPSNTVLVTTLDVTDNSISSAPTPIGDDNFKIKNESNFVKATGTHAADFIEQFSLNTEASHIVLESIIEIRSLALGEGFKAYPGKQITITNNGSARLKIKANHSENVKFIFSNNADYYAWPKESVTFYLSDDLFKANFLSSNFSNVQKTRTINGNVTLDNSYNNCIVFITNTCTITIPTGLPSDFNCVFIVVGNYIATFTELSGVTLNAVNGKKLGANKNASIVTAAANSLVLRGELES